MPAPNLTPVTTDSVSTIVLPLNREGNGGVAQRFDIRDEHNNVLFRIDASDDSIGGEAVPKVRVLAQLDLRYDEFTDGGGAVGTYALTGSIPAGAVILGTKVLVSAGFTGNVSATLTIGDGSDVDRYMTGTPSVFATAATGIETGPPSGNRLLTAANSPTVTVTASTDFTLVNAGSMDVFVYYIDTV